MRTAILTVLLLGATACASSATVGSGGTTADDLAPPAATAAASDARELTGTLGGDPALEGGCVWVDTPAGRIEVVWPDGWNATADPVELRGPDGEIAAAAGDEVTIAGMPATDRVSTCQVGTIWQATSVEAG